MPLQLWRAELRRIAELIEVASGSTVVPNVQDAVIPELLGGIRVAYNTNVVEAAIANVEADHRLITQLRAELEDLSADIGHRAILFVVTFILWFGF